MLLLAIRDIWGYHDIIYLRLMSVTVLSNVLGMVFILRQFNEWRKAEWDQRMFLYLWWIQISRAVGHVNRWKALYIQAYMHLNVIGVLYIEGLPHFAHLSSRNLISETAVHLPSIHLYGNHYGYRIKEKKIPFSNAIVIKPGPSKQSTIQL